MLSGQVGLVVVSFLSTRPPLAPLFTQWGLYRQVMSHPTECPALERLASGVIRLGVEGVETLTQPLHKCHARLSRFNISKGCKCSDNRLSREEQLPWNRLKLQLLNRQA